MRVMLKHFMDYIQKLDSGNGTSGGQLGMVNFQEKCGFIWSIAEILRGDYKQSEYGRVILPFTVLRRLDCVLASTKQRVLERAEQLKTSKLTNVEPILNRITGQP